MFAVIAAVLFFVALFEQQLGEVDLVVAGLLCVALHLALGIALPWPRRG